MCLIVFLSGLVLVWATGCEEEKIIDEGKTEAVEQIIAPTVSKESEGNAVPKAETKVEEQQAEAPKAADRQSQGASMKELLDDVFYWKLVAKDWYGKKAPDFALTDINGKEHKLSDYKGKNVIVLSWTMWCPGSQSQVDFLNEIREQISDDKLAILAVCHKTDRESLEKVEEFAAKKKLKFPVFYAALDALPSPFDSNQYVPCSYFIEQNGNFKLIVEEIVSIRYIRKILEAR